MIKQLIDTSIKSAIDQNWTKAITLNQQILEKVPDHIPTLNRLANAYFSIGEHEKAAQVYQQVLELDKFNSIAQKSLKKISQCTVSSVTKKDVDLNFIEEPGKTKTFPLTRLADSSIIAHLRPGEIVILKPKNRLICVYTQSGEHIGALTDDVAYHLRTFIDAGYTYQVTIKSTGENTVDVFLREVKRTQKLDNSPTFTD